MSLTSRFSRHFSNFTTHKRSFSCQCQYEPRLFVRFGYIGAFLIGNIFFIRLRNDHIAILRNIEDVQKELNDIKCIINKKE